MDIWTKEKRSEVMSLIKSRDTGPEKIIRSLLHSSGLRFRLYGNNLPGTPDLIFPKYKSVLFVNGCFWHYHQKCRDGKIPKSRKAYWKSKLMGNVERDKKNIKKLKKLGWRVMVLWECEIKNKPKRATSSVVRFLKK